MEELENDEIAVLDLKQKVDRKTKSIRFSVNYKKTHTNINVDERSNHPEMMKRAIVKGFGDRARSLCDENNVNEELRNLEEIFVENGYTKDKIREYLSERQPKVAVERDEKLDRGTVTIPYLKGFSEIFKRIASKHGIKTAFRPGTKVKELKSTARTPLGEKKANVVYSIPCKCEKNIYVGETYRMFETRKKEHEAKVRLTKKDIEDGNIESAEIRMGKEDGGIARHSTQCSKDIDWKKSKVICTEKGFKQRKGREGVESKKLKLKGKTPLNNYEHPEDWKAIILGYTKLEPPTKD